MNKTSEAAMKAAERIKDEGLSYFAVKRNAEIIQSAIDESTGPLREAATAVMDDHELGLSFDIKWAQLKEECAARHNSRNR